MTSDNAHTAVALSAFWVALIFAYRKLTEASSTTPSKAVPNTAHFIIGFGFVYVVLSTIAEFAPELGGMFAVLIATGDTLVNGQALFGDVTGALKATSTATGGG